MARYSTVRSTEVEMAFSLIFTESGDIRLTRGEGKLDRGERSMAMLMKVPRSLWRTANLRATIEIADPGNPKAEIDVTAAANAIRETLGDGVNIELAVKSGE